MPSTERTALARLEELGDVLAVERERTGAPPDPGQDPSEVAIPPPRSAGLLRSNVVVATGTTLSRLTGLLRVIVFAYVIGKGALADAYLIGNETPNIVYELLLGGVLSATLVPLFTSFLHHRDDGSMEEDEAGAHATNVVITVTMVAVTVLTIIAFLAAPLIFGLYTIHTEGTTDPEVLREVGTLLTRVFLLQIFFYGATGLLSAYLNARRRFFAAAWSPIAANVVIIVSLLTLRGTAWELTDVLSDHRLRWTLALGATVGIATMAVLLAVAVRHSGLRFRPAFEPRHPAIRRLVTLSAWTLGYVACNQIVTIVIRNLSGPGSGDSAAYFQAFTFFVLPHGLLAVSIATTFEPEMAIAVRRHDKAAFIDRTSLGVRLIALLTLPAAMLLFVLRRPMIGLAARTRRVHVGRRADHLAGARWVRPRPGRVLRLPVHVPRVLRPPGHPHAVHDQRRAVHPQHHLGLRLRRAVGGARARRRLRRVVPGGGGVGAAGDVVQGARVPVHRRAGGDDANGARRGARRRGHVVGSPARRRRTPASTRWCGSCAAPSWASPCTPGSWCC